MSINYSGGFRDSDKEYSTRREEYIGGGTSPACTITDFRRRQSTVYNSLRIDYTRQPSDKRIFIASLL